MMTGCSCLLAMGRSISGLVAEYIVAIDVTRVRFPADAAIPKARLALVGVRLWQQYKNV